MHVFCGVFAEVARERERLPGHADVGPGPAVSALAAHPAPHGAGRERYVTTQSCDVLRITGISSAFDCGPDVVLGGMAVPPMERGDGPGCVALMWG